MPNITTNHVITYTNSRALIGKSLSSIRVVHTDTILIYTKIKGQVFDDETLLTVVISQSEGEKSF